ncbi:MAG: hypothetical protein HRT45_13335, partial [Bdellovibrionales bacterium]|nr:hypothetical protein [Bdellovibrionales bacterium]
PAEGRPSVANPAQGVPAGDLKIEVKQSVPSVPPVAVAFGGVGQKGAPQRAGGNASESTLSWSGLTNQLNLSNPQNSSASEARRFLPRPTMRILNRIFEKARRNAVGSIELFYLKDIWWELLNNEQKAKVKTACGGAELDKPCASRLVNEAATALVEDYRSQAAASQSENEIIERLQSQTYIEAEGLIGPINENGQRGEEGVFEWALTGRE